MSYMPSGSRERFFSRLFSWEEWRRGREYGREGLISGACYGDGVWQGTVTGALGCYRVRVKRESAGKAAAGMLPPFYPTGSGNRRHLRLW